VPGSRLPRSRGPGRVPDGAPAARVGQRRSPGDRRNTAVPAIISPAVTRSPSAGVATTVITPVITPVITGPAT